jgi:hypothetical protein
LIRAVVAHSLARLSTNRPGLPFDKSLPLTRLKKLGFVSILRTVFETEAETLILPLAFDLTEKAETRILPLVIENCPDY